MQRNRLSLQLQSAHGEEKLSSRDSFERCSGRGLKHFLRLSQSSQILAHSIRRLSKTMSDLFINPWTNCAWSSSQTANPTSYRISTRFIYSHKVVTSTCKTLDEREILKNAYELLSAFDELVTLGYRENLTISQIKTFLEMESHERGSKKSSQGYGNPQYLVSVT